MRQIAVLAIAGLFAVTVFYLAWTNRDALMAVFGEPEAPAVVEKPEPTRVHTLVYARGLNEGDKMLPLDDLETRTTVVPAGGKIDEIVTGPGNFRATTVQELLQRLETLNWREMIADVKAGDPVQWAHLGESLPPSVQAEPEAEPEPVEPWKDQPGWTRAVSFFDSLYLANRSARTVFMTVEEMQPFLRTDGQVADIWSEQVVNRQLVRKRIADDVPVTIRRYEGVAGCTASRYWVEVDANTAETLRALRRRTYPVALRVRPADQIEIYPSDEVCNGDTCWAAINQRLSDELMTEAPGFPDAGAPFDMGVQGEDLPALPEGAGAPAGATPDANNAPGQPAQVNPRAPGDPGFPAATVEMADEVAPWCPDGRGEPSDPRPEGQLIEGLDADLPIRVPATLPRAARATVR